MKNAVIKKDGYTSYKISHHRKYNPKTKKLRGGDCVFAIDKGNKLSFRKVSYMMPFLAINPTKFLIFSAKNGRLYIYSVDISQSKTKKVKQIVTPENFNWRLSSLWGKFMPKPTQMNRVRILIKKWAKKNGIKMGKEKDITETVFKTIYPDLYLPAMNTVSTSFSKFLRGQSLKYAVKKCFGNGGKKIVGLVGQHLEKHKNYKILNLGLITKDILPIDTVQKIVESGIVNTGAIAQICYLDYNKQKISELRRLLSNYGHKRIYSILTGGFLNLHTISDALRMWGNMGFVKTVLPESPQSILEIHDHLSHENNKLKNLDYPLEVPEQYVEIDDLITQEFRFEIPKSYHSLIDYGRKMSNCIASYSGEMLKKNCILMGVYKDSELTYNIMVKNKRVSQFYGKHNKVPDPDDSKIILGVLGEKKLIEIDSGLVPF